MIFKRYMKRIVTAKDGFRLKLYFRSADGYRSTLASPILKGKDIKSKYVEKDYAITGIDNFAPDYTDEFIKEMHDHAKDIIDIKELGK